MSSFPVSGKQTDNFAFCRKTAQLLFGKNQAPVPAYFKHPVGSPDKLNVNFRANLFFQFTLQTGGLRFVISGSAIFYRNLHHFLLPKPRHNKIFGQSCCHSITSADRCKRLNKTGDTFMNSGRTSFLFPSRLPDCIVEQLR